MITNFSGTEYDAAHVNLGGDWRMPTDASSELWLKECEAL